MAQVFPFRGLRYDVAQVGDLSDVTCPPYDVIDPGFQTPLYERHPCNVIRLELNRDEPGDENPDRKYDRAAAFLANWRKQGVLMQEADDALYVYHQVFDWEGESYTRRGFLGRIRLERFGEGKVYPHEQTMSGPKADRLKLLQATRTNLSPIFGLFPDADGAVQRPLEMDIARRPPLEAVDHLGVRHRLWAVTDHAAIQAVRDLLHDRPVFIADGHHRYETAINYRDAIAAAGQLAGPEAPENFVMMHFVGMSDPGLVILPTHRLVTGLKGLTFPALREALAGHFEVEEVGHGTAAAHETWDLIDADGGQGVLGFGTTADNTWCLARLTDGSPMRELAPEQGDDWRGLGVSLLHKLVLEYLLKNRHGATPPQCTYVHLVGEVTAAQGAGHCDLACLVPPAGIEHVEKIAERLEKMPPKSTYFYPKLQTGLVFNSLQG